MTDDHRGCGQMISDLQQRADLLDTRLDAMTSIAVELAAAASQPWHRQARRARIQNAVDDLVAFRTRIAR